MRRALGVAVVVQLLTPAVSIAETPLQRLGLSGSLRGSYWSSSRELDDGQHFFGSALWLKATPRLGERLSILAEGWVRNEELFHEDATRGDPGAMSAEAGTDGGRGGLVALLTSTASTRCRTSPSTGSPSPPSTWSSGTTGSA